MTAAFEEFMRQHKMTGSEKADGYSRDVFIGLDEHERSTVFDLLVAELPFSAQWLFLVDRENAIAVMKDIEQKTRKDAYTNTYRIQEELVRLCGDLDFQSHIIDDYPYYTNRLKPYVVNSVARTPQNRETLAFYKQVILAESNKDAVEMAASELLDASKVPSATNEEKDGIKQLMNALVSDNAYPKMKAIERIERYEKEFFSKG